MDVFKEIAGVSRLEFCEYNVKCFVGVTVGYFLYKAFPQQSGQYLWLLISILLSITHDNNSKVAYDRMKGNVLGSAAGLFTFLLHNPPNLLTICIGVALTIAICFSLKLISVSRTALVAFIIVVLYEEAHSSWEGAVYRMASVVVGCLIGLVINYAFRRIAITFYRTISTSAAERIENEDQRDSGE
ncbi:MAG: FUSC family protein [Thermoguttaceae bacterium]